MAQNPQRSSNDDKPELKRSGSKVLTFRRAKSDKKGEDILEPARVKRSITVSHSPQRPSSVSPESPRPAPPEIPSPRSPESPRSATFNLAGISAPESPRSPTIPRTPSPGHRRRYSHGDEHDSNVTKNVDLTPAPQRPHVPLAPMPPVSEAAITAMPSLPLRLLERPEHTQQRQLFRNFSDPQLVPPRNLTREHTRSASEDRNPAGSPLRPIRPPAGQPPSYTQNQARSPPQRSMTGNPFNWDDSQELDLLLNLVQSTSQLSEHLMHTHDPKNNDPITQTELAILCEGIEISSRLNSTDILGEADELEALLDLLKIQEPILSTC